MKQPKTFKIDGAQDPKRIVKARVSGHPVTQAMTRILARDRRAFLQASIAYRRAV